MFLTVIVFIILLGALVLVHEWGHFIVARKLGVRVEEFAFGFPPRIASVTRRGTRYALNLIPLGGYVKIYGESGEEPGADSFSSRPVYQRAAIIVAGVAMNVILAWALFTLGHGIGLPTVLTGDESATGASVTIVGIAPGSPAETAGLRFGDAIVQLTAESEQVTAATIDQVQGFVARHRGEEVTLRLKRGNGDVTLQVRPRLDPPAGEGALGIAMARVGIVRAPWWRAPWDGLKTTANSVAAIGTALARTARELFAEHRVSADVSGPVGIFVFANETRRLGLAYLLELAGVLSVNLALLNILPIPALDGGRMLFLFLEGLSGARIHPRVEQAVHTIGFALILALMAAITYRDIVRVF